MKRLSLLFLPMAGLVVCVAWAQTPETAPKLYIEMNGPVLKNALTKHCPSDVTVVDQIKAAPFRLDLHSSSMKWNGTLYNKADDELAKFRAFRTADFVKQVCGYFQSLKANRP